MEHLITCSCMKENAIAVTTCRTTSNTGFDSPSDELLSFLVLAPGTLLTTSMISCPLQFDIRVLSVARRIPAMIRMHINQETEAQRLHNWINLKITHKNSKRQHTERRQKHHRNRQKHYRNKQTDTFTAT